MDDQECPSDLVLCTTLLVGLFAFPFSHLHVRGPQGQVVPEKLHDQGAVLVGLLAQGVELGDGLVESLRQRAV